MDFTYLFLENHEVRYNCSMIDLYDCSIVASITGGKMTSSLAMRTLRRALDSQTAIKGKLILHTDQGEPVYIEEICRILRIRTCDAEHEQGCASIRQCNNGKIFQHSEERAYQSIYVLYRRRTVPRS